MSYIIIIVSISFIASAALEIIGMDIMLIIISCLTFGCILFSFIWEFIINPWREEKRKNEKE